MGRRVRTSFAAVYPQSANRYIALVVRETVLRRPRRRRSRDDVWRGATADDGRARRGRDHRRGSRRVRGSGRGRRWCPSGAPDLRTRCLKRLRAVHSHLSPRFGGSKTKLLPASTIALQRRARPRLGSGVLTRQTARPISRLGRKTEVRVMRSRHWPIHSSRRSLVRWKPISQENVMYAREDERPDVNPRLTEPLWDDDRQDLLDPSAHVPSEIPTGLDRRRFMMRSAVISAAAVMTGCGRSEAESKAPPPTAAARPAPAVPLSADLNVVKKGKGPVMTMLDEFYKVGPGPSSSHTIGPMRITYDFYQRCTKLPADQLAKATGLKVHLYGSLSATGKGHGTERASLAGLVGQEPATVDPVFLDSMRDKPNQTFPVKLGAKTFNLTLKDIVFDATKGRLPAPEHHDGQAHGRRQGALRAGVLLGGRRIHRVERVHASQEEPAEVPVRHDEGIAAARREKQADDCASHPGERDVDLRQERAGDLRLHRQDHGRDGGDREVRAQCAGRRAARSNQAADQSGDRLQARHG